MAAWLAEQAAPLAVDYHNITPAEYFEQWQPAAAQVAREARGEMRRLASATAYCLADSGYNAGELAKEGIECDVLDMRTIRPLDIASILESLKKTSRIVVVDQSWPFGSVASEVITQVTEKGFDWLDAPPRRVNSDDVPTPYAKPLEQAYLPNKDKIVAAVREAIA